MPAKTLHMAPGSPLIQNQYIFSDEELVEQIRENPYYQYFIGLSGYEDKIPFVPSLPALFRKRLTEEKLEEIYELIIEYYNHISENLIQKMMMTIQKESVIKQIPVQKKAVGLKKDKVSDKKHNIRITQTE